MNLLLESINTLRAKFIMRCVGMILSSIGSVLLILTDWRIALGVALLIVAGDVAASTRS